MAAGASLQGMRPAPRHAQRGGEISAIQVVPEVQLDCLSLARLQLSEDGADQHGQTGLLGAVVSTGRAVRRVGRLADRSHGKGRVGWLKRNVDLLARVASLIRLIGLLDMGRWRSAQSTQAF